MSNLALFGGPKTISDEHPLKSSWAQMSLDRALCEYTGAKYVRCVSSGTAALISSLFAAGCGPGDEVLTVAYTWVSTVGAILRVNAVPVFADIDPRTFTMDVEDAKRKITPQTKAILPVDFYGHPAPIPELMELAQAYGIVVVEDACQASTAEINGVKVGNIAHITAFSWSGKPIYSSSGGGAFLTNDRMLFERALLAGQHPTVIAGLATEPDVLRYASMGGTGDNMRSVGLDAMAQLMDAEVRTNARIHNCDYLTEHLSKIPGITPPYVRPGYKHVYHYYNCLWDPDTVYRVTNSARRSTPKGSMPSPTSTMPTIALPRRASRFRRVAPSTCALSSRNAISMAKAARSSARMSRTHRSTARVTCPSVKRWLNESSPCSNRICLCRATRATCNGASMQSRKSWITLMN